MDNQLSYFFEDEEIDDINGDQNIQFPVFDSPDLIPREQPFKFRAMNVEEMFRQYPPDLQRNLINFSIKNKHLAGLQGIVGVSTKVDESKQFLQSIDSQVFLAHEKDSYKNFSDLFQQIEEESSPQMQVDLNLVQLSRKMEEIQNRAFGGINLKKTIGRAFTQHFQNFLYIKQQSNFMGSFINSLENFYSEAKQIRTPGIELITLTYDFWMKMFKQFVKEIWKHSQKYTLTLLKKQKGETGTEQSYCAKSTGSSSQAGGIEKQKRRPWTKSELQILQKIIEANAVFSQARLQELAEQFNRTTSSISSKVQKMTKNKKKDLVEDQNKDDISIEAKIKYILQINSVQLTKQDIIQRITQNYEMGMDDSWKNSVSTLLSSSPNFIKLKMPYKLKNPMIYYNYTFSSTSKDKIIQCLLEMPKKQGDIKDIAKQYIRIFHGYEPDIHQRKQIQSNISKTLSRYGIFERQNSKTLYKLSHGALNQDIDIEKMLCFS